MNTVEPTARPTRRQRDLLKQLMFREVDPIAKVCWLTKTLTDQRRLIVPTMMGTWEYHSNYIADTILIMEKNGWITRGPTGKLPFTLNNQVIYGRSIKITDTGRAAANRH